MIWILVILILASPVTLAALLYLGRKEGDVTWFGFRWTIWPCLLVVAVLSGCGTKHVTVGAPVNREFYAYVKVSEATYHILARDPRHLEIALDEIGCRRNPQHICFVERRGEFFVVEQR